MRQATSANSHLPLARRSNVGQLGFVPRDFQAALDFWTKTMQVGPFFLIKHVPFTNVVYRGSPIEIDASVALAYWGDLQIELIEQHNDVLSAYTESASVRRDGLHHIRADAGDIDELHARYLKNGGSTLMTATVPGGGRVIYVDMGDGGPYIELPEIAPEFLVVNDYIKRAAESWDGQDGVRSLPDDPSKYAE